MDVNHSTMTFSSFPSSGYHYSFLVDKTAGVNMATNLRRRLKNTSHTEAHLAYVVGLFHSFMSRLQSLLRTLAASHGKFLNLFRHLVRLLCTSNQPVAKASSYKGNTTSKDDNKHPYLKWDSNLRRTFVSDCAASGTGD
jgi:hypothetical protein